jgi:hypothetical protein
MSTIEARRQVFSPKWALSYQAGRLQAAGCLPALHAHISRHVRRHIPGHDRFLGLAFLTPKLPPAAVAEVDLDRLVGIWFEIARLPNQEADGVGQQGVDVTATYTK